MKNAQLLLEKMDGIFKRLPFSVDVLYILGKKLLL